MKNWRLQAAASTLAAVVSFMSVTSTASSTDGAGSPTPTPTRQGPAGKAPASPEQPRPYDDFVFKTVDECRKEPAGVTYQSNELRGYAVNHFQWCAWSGVFLILTDDKGRQ